LRLYKEVLGERHPHYASSLNNLAVLYQAMGEHRKALPLLQQALRLRREVQGERHPNYAQSLSNLAGLYQVTGEYGKALPLYQQALGLYKEVLGERHPHYASSLNNLAALSKAMGEPGKALPLLQQALRLRKEVLGERHPDYASSLHNLAGLYQALGEHGKALPLYEQALRLYKEVRGERYPDYASSLNGLAMLYRDMGEHGKALPLFQQVLRLRKEVLGQRHPDYATSLSNLALLYRDMGEHGKALSLFQEALRLHKEVLGERHPHYALSLNNLAALHQDMGEPDKALPLFQQALRLRKEVLGQRHPDYATSLNNLALLYQDMGEYGKALPLLHQALRLCKEVLGERHPHYATSLNNLAALYQERHRASAAVVLSGQALAVKLAHVQDTLSAVDDRQRLILLSQASHSLSVFLTLATVLGVPPGELYRWVLGAKGVLASASRSRLTALGRADPKLQQPLLRLQAARAGLARLVRMSPPPGEMVAWRERFDRLERDKRQAQEELAQASKDFARLLHRPSTAEVATALLVRTALVEFLAYKHFLRYDRSRHGWEWEPRLLAFVVRPGWPVALVPLGDSRAFDTAVRAWRRPLLGRSQAEPDPAVSAWLRQHLWLPLEKHLDGVKTVLIAPDGELANLPFAALPGSKPGSFLLEQYTFGAVASGRQLLDGPATLPAAGLLTVGGASFGTPQRPWRNLPGAALEAEQVQRLFRARFPAAGTRRLTGTDADRAAVLAALTPREKQRWRWLHLATHGYFEPARTRLPAAVPAAGVVAVAAAPGLAGPLQALACVAAVDEPDVLDRRHGFDPSGRSARVHGRNPMLATGLVLAGANRPEGDGVLTAEEISGLDLRGCELAVLSACQTALGKQEGYQGVLGLQRAFHDAGCAHLVASLWSVNDAATSVLMEDFYQQLWKHGRTPLEALRLAQLAVLKDPGRVRKREAELRAALVKRGVSEQELEQRGILAKARNRPAVGKGRERSPVAWWAAFVLSGKP
jgi:CHAT domain-containing protein/Tfp pilus assembly protein PilF